MNGAKILSDCLDVSIENIADIPKVTLLGKEQFMVENFAALAEYKKENIKLKCKNCLIEIIGSNFEIKAINEGIISVLGRIDRVNLI